MDESSCNCDKDGLETSHRGLICFFFVFDMNDSLSEEIGKIIWLSNHNAIKHVSTTGEEIVTISYET